jgi:hypothetical protein
LGLRRLVGFTPFLLFLPVFIEKSINGVKRAKSPQAPLVGFHYRDPKKA